jgi:hypothetical protein
MDSHDCAHSLAAAEAVSQVLVRIWKAGVDMYE